MPELPEVETMRRGILPVVGTTIAELSRPSLKVRPIQFKPRFDLFQKQVKGRCIIAVERVGKRVVLRLDDDSRVIIEPRMTGLVLIGEPPGNEHVRLRFHLCDGENGRRPAGIEQLLFWDRRGLGTVTWASAEEAEKLLGAERLGPDALSVDDVVLRARLGKSKRAIKVALLDQKAVAGIGNLYASEILHVAEVDPRITCERLRKLQWRRIADATRMVLDEAIYYEGSTLSDGTYRNALNKAGGYQNHHRVYDRAGEYCPRCQEATVVRIVQAQRSTFYCPQCQKKR